MSVQAGSTRAPWPAPPPTRDLARSNSEGLTPSPLRWGRALALVLVMLPLATFAETPAQEGDESGSLMDAYLELTQEQERDPSVQALIYCRSYSAAIWSLANRRYVSAELGWTGESYGTLRARASAIGPWERFILCVDSSTGDALLRSAANGLYVAAELGFAGERYGTLRARTSPTQPGPWERFRIVNLGGGAFALWSVANRRYVSAELGFAGERNGTLRARATSIGPWERFY